MRATQMQGWKLIRQQMCPFRERVIMPTEPASIRYIRRYPNGATFQV